LSSRRKVIGHLASLRRHCRNRVVNCEGSVYRQLSGGFAWSLMTRAAVTRDQTVDARGGRWLQPPRAWVAYRRQC